MNSTSISVSVIIPVYNAEDTLSECLDSVLAQTLSNIEIICVNDGSPDNSLEILSGYSARDSRIVVVDQQNSGPAIARNNAIKMAKGEYVVFMDPDDWYPDSGVLELLYKNAREHDVLICGGSLVGYSDGKIVANYDNSSYFRFSKSEMIKYEDYQFDHGYTRFIYNTTFLKENRIYFPDYRRYQDPPFFVKAMIMAKEFYALENVVYCYRMDNKRLVFTARKTNDFLKGMRDVMKLASAANMPFLFEITRKRFNETLYSYIFLNFNENNIEILSILVEMNEIIRNYAGENSLAIRKLFEYFDIQYKKDLRRHKLKAILRVMVTNPTRFIKIVLKKVGKNNGTK